MSSADLLLLLGLMVTASASIGVPLYMRRQIAKQSGLDRAQAAAEATAHGEEVSWEAINRAIVRERDALQAAIRDRDTAHEDRIRQLRETFDAETQRLKVRSDYELDRANTRIEQLGDEVNALYRRLGGGNGPAK